MAIATEKSVSEKRTNLPDEPARRMLYRTLFTPRVGVSFDDERTTHAHLGIPEMYMKMKELGAILRQILDLANGDSTDDDGVLAPTVHAMGQTTRLLIHASTIVWQHCMATGRTFIFPRGFVSTDSEGGLRIEWTKPGASLRLVIAAGETGKSYLYFEFEDKYGSERQVTAELMGRWLVRFLSAR
jgi:hypothetical protein